jgi:hypothetical protein
MTEGPSNRVLNYLFHLQHPESSPAFPAARPHWPCHVSQKPRGTTVSKIASPYLRTLHASQAHPRTSPLLPSQPLPKGLPITNVGHPVRRHRQLFRKCCNPIPAPNLGASIATRSFSRATTGKRDLLCKYSFQAFFKGLRTIHDQVLCNRTNSSLI